MNKTEFMELLSKRTGFSKSNCQKVLTQAKKLVVEVCAKGSEVSIRNFGRFMLKEKPSRRYFNPQTKRFCTARKRKVLEFRSSAAFRYVLDK